ncbi:MULTISPECIES: hypothetical protein [unclassified Nostoc]|uniref:hypothetical protein n=1 Tax=unclassified Nostoc TaxID=2593658 RepID=UPI002AD4FBC0|nr:MULTISPECIES: hypothetical protein [unclassified Nostoc]MDZ8127090.1 hypothetical protein [Nostoc sp. CmiVER01]MDZ8222375.1 hypothetical protein [Nostoc sp. ChiVER01]
MEADKLAVNKGNNKDKVINVQIGRTIKYPLSSTMLVGVQKFMHILLFLLQFFKLVFESEKSMMQPY